MKKRSTTRSLRGRVLTTLAAFFTASLTSFGSTITMNTLTIGIDAEYTVPLNDTLIVENIIFSKGSTLYVNGVLLCKDATGFLDFTLNIQSEENQGTVSIFNNGKIECKNFNLCNDITPKEDLLYENNGTILCEGNFIAILDNDITFASLCASKIEADSITFQGRAGGEYNGMFKANYCTIDITEGNVGFDIGSDCGTSIFDVLELVLKHNTKDVNVNEQARLRSIDISNTSGNVHVEIDGILSLGLITDYSKLHIIGSENSILNLCYNPSPGKDFLGTSSFSGRVVYLQRDDIPNVWKSGSSPKTEEDIMGTCSEIADKTSTYEQCLDGLNLSSLLPIEITSFSVQGFENTITLKWEVATENNIYNYRVEYSRNGTDWQEIDVVGAMGTTSLPTHYTSTITNYFPYEYLYFRLKQITFDGVESYSQTIVLGNSTTNDSFKILKIGYIEILYNNTECRYIKR